MRRSEKSLLRRIFPPKFFRLGAIILGFNCLVYYGSRLVNLGGNYHCITLPIDEAIPFVPAFIIIYILAFAQWGLGYLELAHEEDGTCRKFLWALLIAKALCAVCFLVYPTCMTARPIPEGRDLFSRLCAMIFFVDTPPDNLFPSIHCMESWMCLRLTMQSKKLPPWVKAGCGVFTLLVFASVLLVKQHVFIDVPAGIAAGELGLLLSRLFVRERKNEK